LDAAVSFTFCGVPGLIISVDGLAVTPAGRPLIEIATALLKPLTGLALTEIFWPAAPSISMSVAGFTASVKSPAGGGGGGSAATVSAKFAVWVKLSDVPVTVTVTFPLAAVDDAVTVTFCDVPGVSVSVDGVAVTPDGSPPIATVMLPVNPLAAVAFTATVFPEAPAVTLTVEGEAVRAKSAVGVGVPPPGLPSEGEEPLPQAASRPRRPLQKRKRKNL